MRGGFGRPSPLSKDRTTRKDASAFIWPQFFLNDSFIYLKPIICICVDTIVFPNIESNSPTLSALSLVPIMSVIGINDEITAMSILPVQSFTNDSAALTAAIQSARQRRNAAVEYLNSLGSETSRAGMRSKLKIFAQWYKYPSIETCEWGLMRREHIVDFMEYLKTREQSENTGEVQGARQKNKSGLQANSINNYLCALKGVARAAWALDQINDHELQRITAIKQLRFYRQPAGRALTFREGRKMLEACSSDNPQQIRDLAILSLLLGCGLRRAEVPALQMNQIHLDSGYIRLIGKGNKERTVYLNGEVKENLTNWINYRGSEEGYVFGRFTKGCKHLVLDKPLVERYIGKIVERYQQSSGQGTVKPATPHDLRRTFATRLLDKGVDVSLVKTLMGHASVATTALYDRRGEESLREAASKIEL